jgi:hypothetical protein
MVMMVMVKERRCQLSVIRSSDAESAVKVHEVKDRVGDDGGEQ